MSHELSTEEGGPTSTNKELTVDIILPPSMVRFFDLAPAEDPSEEEYINTYFIRFLNVWGLTLGVRDVSDVHRILILARFEMHNKDTFSERISCWKQQDFACSSSIQPPRQPSYEEFEAIWGENIELDRINRLSTIVVPEQVRPRKTRWLRKFCCLGIFKLYIIFNIWKAAMCSSLS